MSKIRIVTAASLFDGHDAAINIMRRIIQAQGAEVIHLGHDRRVPYKKMPMPWQLHHIKADT